MTSTRAGVVSGHVGVAGVRGSITVGRFNEEYSLGWFEKTVKIDKCETLSSLSCSAVNSGTFRDPQGHRATSLLLLQKRFSCQTQRL